MMRRIALRVSLLAVLAVPAFAEEGDVVDQRRRLIEQKVRLFESIVNSMSARMSEAAALSAQQARRALDEAKEAIAANRIEHAGRALDVGLKDAAKAAARTAVEDASANEQALKASLRDLATQVTTYTASIEEQVRSGRAEGGTRALLDQIDRQVRDARGLEAAGRLEEAKRKMAEAYRWAAEGLSVLRAGQTVTQSLKFDTPADEFAYEQRRFASNEILVDMMAGEGRAAGERRAVVDTHVGTGRRLRAEADQLARAGDYKGAVTAMEQASGQLNRALQLMGVPVY